MSNYDRGIYEPSDEVRVFDGAEEDDDVEGSRLPLLIVLALLVLAMFAGVVWLAYTQGVARGRGETPVLTAAAGPERVAPPGGGASGTVPYQGFKIYEQPAPPDDEVDNAPKPPPAAAAPKPAPVAQAPAAPKPAPAAAPPAPAPAAMTAPPKPTPAPAAAKPPAPAPKSVASLIQQANTAPPAAKPAPAPKPAASPPAMKQAVVPPPTATGAPRQLGLTATPPPAAAKPAPAVPASAPAKSAVAGGYVLQIGSYKSQGDAEAAWKTYKGRHAALLSGYSENIQQADLGEKGTWYRLRIGGLGDREVALALCDRLKADGGVCILGH